MATSTKPVLKKLDVDPIKDENVVVDVVDELKKTKKKRKRKSTSGTTDESIKQKTKKKRKPRVHDGPTPVNPWLDHVKAFKLAHPDMKFKEVLERAGKTYTKVPVVKREPGAPRKPNPWMEHIGAWIKKNPAWRQTHNYKQVLQLCKETYKKDATKTDIKTDATPTAV